MTKALLTSFLLFTLLAHTGLAQTAASAPGKPAPVGTAAKPADVPFVTKTLANGLEIIVCLTLCAARNGRARGAQRLVYRAARAQRAVAFCTNTCSLSRARPYC